MTSKSQPHQMATQAEVMNIACLAPLKNFNESDYFASVLEAGGGFSVAINAEKIIRATKDEEFRSLIESATVRYADGMPVSSMLRKLGFKKAAKINLPKLVIEICTRQQLSLAIVGATPEVNRTAVSLLLDNSNQPPAVIGTHGYQSDAELTEFILANAPRVVLLGLGSPRQENLAASLCAQGYSGFVVPCGGAIDVLAGKKKAAPAWVQKTGMETPYRFAQEPSRWRRYIKLAPFACSWLIEYARLSIKPRQ